VSPARRRSCRPLAYPAATESTRPGPRHPQSSCPARPRSHPLPGATRRRPGKRWPSRAPLRSPPLGGRHRRVRAPSRLPFDAPVESGVVTGGCFPGNGCSQRTRSRRRVTIREPLGDGELTSPAITRMVPNELGSSHPRGCSTCAFAKRYRLRTLAASMPATTGSTPRSLGTVDARLARSAIPARSASRSRHRDHLRASPVLRHHRPRTGDR